MSSSQPAVAFFPAHPAQLWLMYTVAKALGNKVKIVWILRDKDVLLAIANKLGLEYSVISKARTGMLGNMAELLINIVRAIQLTRKYNIQLWLTKYGAGNIASRFCARQSISFNDDDIDIVPLIAITSYPFAQKILAPQWVRMGRYGKKTIRFKGSHELIYLHPSRFVADKSKLSALGIAPDNQFLLIRMSALTAHHDVGITGMSEQLLDNIIERYSNDYKIFVSSEKPLAKRFSPYQLRIDVTDIHHILHYAACIVTDSLSMALEAAVLGTASIRVSDFGLQISAFEAIEEYGLVYNYSPDATDEAIFRIDDVLKSAHSGELRLRSAKLVADMEDPLPYYTNTILRQLSLML